MWEDRRRKLSPRVGRGGGGGSVTREAVGRRGIGISSSSFDFLLVRLLPLEKKQIHLNHLKSVATLMLLMIHFL